MVFFHARGLCNIASIIAKLFDRMVRKQTGRQQVEARDAEQILLEALNAGAQKKNKNTAQEDGEIRKGRQWKAKKANIGKKQRRSPPDVIGSSAKGGAQKWENSL